MSSEINLALWISLPKNFPTEIPEPQFQVGACVCWQPLPSQDFGIVTGLQYAPAEHLQAWHWRYVIWLDADSPSRRWTLSDTAWEEDLEPFLNFNSLKLGTDRVVMKSNR